MKKIVMLSIVAIITITIVKSSIASDLSTTITSSRQLIVVTTASWNDFKARVYRFDRSENGWQKVAGHFQAVIGSKGMAWGNGSSETNKTDALKKEGDRKAPAGIFHLMKAMGYASMPPNEAVFPYERITENSHCVDDKDSQYYNRIVKESDLPVPAAELWKSSELMKRKDDLYKWLLVVDHNVKDPKRGDGSCIFIHVWRSAEKGTAGCTAMAEKDIVELIRWLKSDADPVLVQLPQAVYEQYWKQWDLPAPAAFLY